MRFIQFRSAPAQKAGPFAASTMQRTDSRWPRSRKAAVSIGMSSSLKALRASGRSSVMVAMAPLTSVCSMAGSWWLLHPDHRAVDRIQLALHLGVAFATGQCALHGIGRQGRVLGPQARSREEEARRG